MQQHLMQMQPMMAAYYPNNVTTDHIQQYLDENKSLILKIVESQNSGKLSECAEKWSLAMLCAEYCLATINIRKNNKDGHKEMSLRRNQARLQRNLMYLAAIADSQPQLPTLHPQFSSGGVLQPGANYMQHQQAQLLPPQSVMAARPSMYAQQPYLHQQQALHSQLGMSSGSAGIHMLQSEAANAGSSGALGVGAYIDFGRGSPGEGLHIGSRGMAGGSKQDIGSSEGQGGNSDGQGGDGGETL